MELFDLDLPIIDFGNGDVWTLRHAVEGVQIFGGIGSGKTSGSGRMLALKYLSNGFGGLVLTVKPDEKQMWVDYCKIAGREKDLIVVEPGGKYHFNFLEYESSNASGNNSITDNLVEVLKTVIRAGEEKDSGKSDDSFWETALDMLIFNVIDLCKLAYGSLSLQKMYDIVQTTLKANEKLKPQSEAAEFKEFQKAMEAARTKVVDQVNNWYDSLSEENKSIYDNDQLLFDEDLMDTVPDARLFRFLDQFFIDNFKNLSDKTRSIIDFSFSGFLFRLLREPVYSLFCRRQSNFSPEDSLNGKIIVINLPVKVYHKVGRDCQILFKYIWQRAMEKRPVTNASIPVFLWADEAQNFLHEHDADYQATARSSKIATVYISQNLPNYYGSMGGQKAEFKVKSFLGTLGTKIFHANADIETNQYASSLVGEDYNDVISKSINTGGDNFSHGRNVTTELEKLVRPEEFVRLKTGGPKNNFKVAGIVHRQGDGFSNGYNHKPATFNQRYNL